MPLRVNQLKGANRVVDIPVEGEDEPIRVEYKPGELTLEISDKIKDAMEGGFEGDVAGLVLEPILVDWDLLREDGTPLPCNGEEIKRLPLVVLGTIMQGISQDLMPDPQKSGTSPSTSNSTDEQDASRTGSFFSEQPIDLAAHRGS